MAGTPKKRERESDASPVSAAKRGSSDAPDARTIDTPWVIFLYFMLFII
jgi:hypothetical protein